MINVLVTGVGGGGVGEQILKSLRLSTLNLRVCGADITETSKGRVCVDDYIVLPSAGSPEYLAALLRKCNELNINAIFPGSEMELKVLVANRAKLSSLGIFLSANSKDVVDVCLDKRKTVSFLEANGFSYPKSYVINSISDCKPVEIFPLVMKPLTGAGGSANTFIIQTREELYFYAAHMLSLYREFIVQEYVGTSDEEYTVGIVSAPDGRIVSSVALKRLISSGLGCKTRLRNKSGRQELGSHLVISSGISQGRIGKYPEVTSQCERIATVLGSRGPLNIQCRLVGGCVYVFEINPRHSGTTAMRALAGVNEPELMLRLGLLKEGIEKVELAAEGWMLRGLDEAFIVS